MTFTACVWNNFAAASAAARRRAQLGGARNSACARNSSNSPNMSAVVTLLVSQALLSRPTLLPARREDQHRVHNVKNSNAPTRVPGTCEEGARLRGWWRPGKGERGGLAYQIHFTTLYLLAQTCARTQVTYHVTSDKYFMVPRSKYMSGTGSTVLGYEYCM